ncbi:GNAT family N-acetyltransferase [Nisaea acidiphila]|uniref:GNAT family N-acetyltransferase n=1 Tax=Nisaea acidiphila TaxID=1862145 RepID=A0A9J7AZQ7_9PROT|nr:GNAT family N-acetyltransferase [Nisaea acidiphila]UUX51732.1 GNAT family N-acetyltransferase [Nisaea acidiphila]
MSEQIKTRRLRLKSWEQGHFAPFAEMHADEEVMADLGGALDLAASHSKFERYREALRQHGISRWAVEDLEGRFIGYAGVMPRLSPGHPLGAHYEVGWRLVRRAWGHGYATESARAALDDANNRLGITGIISYTGAENVRSQSVMRKLGLVRRSSLDFVQQAPGGGTWHGLVWSVDNPKCGG